MPPESPPALDPGKLYLRLSHGRTDPEATLDDWGSEGPTIGPMASIQTTYMCDVKFAASPTVMDRFFPDVIGEWRARRYSNALGPLCHWHLDIVEDLVCYAGVYYGDWTIFVADIPADG